MTPAKLHRAVARATGESVANNKHMGFNPICLPIPNPNRTRRYRRRHTRTFVRMKPAGVV